MCNRNYFVLSFSLLAQLSHSFHVGKYNIHHPFKNMRNGAVYSEEKTSTQQQEVESVEEVTPSKGELMPSPSERRKMDLSWCAPDTCMTGELREQVVGQHNNILFKHPATGQVTYQWADSDSLPTPKVLILVKQNDDDLLRTAADVSVSTCFYLVQYNETIEQHSHFYD